MKATKLLLALSFRIAVISYAIVEADWPADCTANRLIIQYENYHRRRYVIRQREGDFPPRRGEREEEGGGGNKKRMQKTHCERPGRSLAYRRLRYAFARDHLHY